eukprot:359226-Chlamydomonas_euryale.AAC.2
MAVVQPPTLASAFTSEPAELDDDAMLTWRRFRVVMPRRQLCHERVHLSLLTRSPLALWDHGGAGNALGNALGGG